MFDEIDESRKRLNEPNTIGYHGTTEYYIDRFIVEINKTQERIVDIENRLDSIEKKLSV